MVEVQLASGRALGTFAVGEGEDVAVRGLRRAVAEAMGVQAAFVKLLRGERLLTDDDQATAYVGSTLLAVRSFPGFSVSFQPEGLAAPEGFAVDHGDTFGPRPGGWEYGWAIRNVDGIRARQMNDDPLLDTLCVPDRHGLHHWRQRWQLRLPSGAYCATLGLGDAQYGGHYCGAVNGVPFRVMHLDPNEFEECSVNVLVEDVLEIVGSWPHLSSLCYVRVSEASLEDVAPVPKAPAYGAFPETLRVSFQADHVAVGAPPGYVIDAGKRWGRQSCGLDFGWTEDNTSGVRARMINSDVLLDTLVIPDREQRHGGKIQWAVQVPDGLYTVVLGLGDAQYGGSFFGAVNGSSFGVRKGPNLFEEVSLQVEAAGEIRLAGSWPELSSICYLHVSRC